MPFDPIVKRTEGTVKEVASGKVTHIYTYTPILLHIFNHFSTLHTLLHRCTRHPRARLM
jgi:hypothetical protein